MYFLKDIVIFIINIHIGKLDIFNKLLKDIVLNIWNDQIIGIKIPYYGIKAATGMTLFTS